VPLAAVRHGGQNATHSSGSGPEFFFYAIADGVCRLFARYGRWNGLDGPDEEPEDPCQLELALQ
jgi:hypothetical protein